MAAYRVQVLLMGGQACVFYGGAEFSRDTDLLILSDRQNLDRLGAALNDLQAECIAVPSFAQDYLDRGHAIHFRCSHPEATDMRVDVMSKLRGVESFSTVWERRTTIADEQGTTYELLGLVDLVKAKKTQRSKDWPMIQRLLEAHYFQNRLNPTMERQRFWLRELRTPSLLIEAMQKWPDVGSTLIQERPLLGAAASTSGPDLEALLEQEEASERELDRQYWMPLKKELEQLRHSVGR